jgi:hypothetical protein
VEGAVGIGYYTSICNLLITPTQQHPQGANINHPHNGAEGGAVRLWSYRALYRLLRPFNAYFCHVFSTGSIFAFTSSLIRLKTTPKHYYKATLNHPILESQLYHFPVPEPHIAGYTTVTELGGLRTDCATAWRIGCYGVHLLEGALEPVFSGWRRKGARVEGAVGIGYYTSICNLLITPTQQHQQRAIINHPHTVRISTRQPNAFDPPGRNESLGSCLYGENRWCFRMSDFTL